MTVNKRTQALQDHAVFPGFYVVSPNNRLRAFLLPQKVRLDDTSSKSEVLMGTTVNKTTFLKPESCALECTHNILCLVEKGKAPELFITGAPFTQATAPSLATWIKVPDVEHVLIKVPLCFPIPHGVPLGVGKLTEQSVYDTLSMISEDGGKWPDLIENWNRELQEAAVTNSTTLGDMFPALKKGQRWGSEAKLKISPVDEDLEDQLDIPLSKLKDEVENIRKEHFRKAEEAAREAANEIDADTIGTSPVSEFAFSRKVPTTKDELSVVTVGTTNVITPEAMRTARLEIFLATLDTDKSMLPPILTDEATQVHSASSARLRVDYLQSAILAKQEELNEKRCYIERFTDYPTANTMPYGFLAEGQLRIQPLTCLTEANEKKGFCCAHWLPDSPASATTRESTDDIRAAEELLGEATEHLTKFDTSIAINTNLSRITDLQVLCANVICYIRTMVAVDDLDQPPPLLFTVAEEMANLITSPRVRAMLKKDKDTNAYFAYWGFATIEQFVVLAAKNTRVPSALRAAINGNFASIPAANLEAAYDGFNLQLRRCVMAANGVDTIPEPIIWRNSNAKKKKEEAIQRDQALKLRTLLGSDTPKSRDRQQSNKDDDKRPTKFPKLTNDTSSSEGDVIY